MIFDFTHKSLNKNVFTVGTMPTHRQCREGEWRLYLGGGTDNTRKICVCAAGWQQIMAMKSAIKAL